MSGLEAVISTDQPAGILDTCISVAVLGIFQGFNPERDITVLLITDEPDIAEYGSRIIAARSLP